MSGFDNLFSQNKQVQPAKATL